MSTNVKNHRTATTSFATHGGSGFYQPDENREQYNIVVVGHVDHGKSTVIGRLLADTGSLPDGKLEEVRLNCERNAKPFEYAFLLDALKAEQAQGITIDTARCFFKSGERDYIIIDAPGHIEFLKNMVTGAARAEAAILVIDAKEGVMENSRRHGYMLSMLGISKVVVAVNKMDLVNYRQDAFDAIVAEYQKFLNQIGVQPIAWLPIAAFHGENLSSQSKAMPWYKGNYLLKAMDALPKEASLESKALRMPVQDVYKFTEDGDDRRIIAGRVETGAVRKGDRVTFYPSGKRALVKTLEEFSAPERKEYAAGTSAGLTLEPEIYVRPGELMVRDGDAQPSIGTRLRVNIFWMGRQPFQLGKKYKIKLATAETTCWLEEIRSVLDASNLDAATKDSVDQHEVGECVLETFKPLAFDLNGDIAQTGRFVIVDGYEIAGGGIVLENLGSERRLLEKHLAERERNWTRSPISADQRAERYGQRSTLVVLSGPAEAPLSALGQELERTLFENGRFAYYLGLSNVLLGVHSDISGAEDRSEVVRRLGEVAHLFTDAGTVFVTSIPELEPGELDVLKALVRPADLIVAGWPMDQTGAVSKEVEESGDIALDASSTLSANVRLITMELFKRAVTPEYYL